MVTVGLIESYGAIAFFIVYFFLADKDRIKSIKGLLNNPIIVVNLVVIVLFSVYMFKTSDDSDEGMRKKNSTKQAILGLMIALMAHTGMKIAPFWLIWVTSYYLNV
jgi:hypothetical protein